MKRVRCPKCDGYIIFDDSRYTAGQQLVFECPDCHKQFGIRIGKAATQQKQGGETTAKVPDTDCGSILVIENVFHYKQEIPLVMGENVIGRYVKGTAINTPIETVDPSVDTTHCIITVKLDKQGNLQYLLRDAPSETGTFVENTILKNNERYPLHDGSVVTIGATTFILHAAGCE